MRSHPPAAPRDPVSDATFGGFQPFKEVRHSIRHAHAATSVVSFFVFHLLARHSTLLPLPASEAGAMPLLMFLHEINSLNTFLKCP
jgi:hypothetical protein